jgi:hypothetical protein
MTNEEKKINTSNYDTLITESLWLDKIYFSRFGEYQGIWLLIAKDDNNYYIYKDYYGSCIGCDSLQGEFDEREALFSKAKEFVDKNYHPFLTIPKEKMIDIIKSGNMESLFPKNVRTYDDEINYNDAEADIALSLAMDQDMITADLILKGKNQELKQKALKKLGYEKFVEEAHSVLLLLHKEGEDELLEIDPKIKGVEAIKFLYVKDASTERRYLLRVPPSIMRVTEGKAWTFEMKEDEYKPVKET